jgi:branched-chain amino acid transport system substrate-binding protein
MKRGLESLKNFDAEGLLAPVTVTTKDHGGGGKTRIDMWDGAKWVPQTDWFSAYDDVIQDIVKKESGEFAKNKQ